MIADSRVQFQWKGRRRAGFLLAVLMVSALALLVLSRYAAITRLGFQIQRDQARLALLQRETEQLKLQVATLQSMARIQAVAEQRLALSSPSGYRLAAPVSEGQEGPAPAGSPAANARPGKQSPAKADSILVKAIKFLLGLPRAEASARR